VVVTGFTLITKAGFYLPSFSVNETMREDAPRTLSVTSTQTATNYCLCLSACGRAIVGWIVGYLVTRGEAPREHENDRSDAHPRR
jgi:hypothetical protein